MTVILNTLLGLEKVECVDSQLEYALASWQAGHQLICLCEQRHSRLILESLLTPNQTLREKVLLEYLCGRWAVWNFCEYRHMKLGVGLIDMREYTHLNFNISANHSIPVFECDFL